MENGDSRWGMRPAWALCLAVLFAALVLCFATLYSWQRLQTQRLAQLGNQATQRMEELLSLQQQKEQLQQQNLHMDYQIDQLRGQLEQLGSQLDSVMLSAALVPATGPGVVVSVQGLEGESAVADSDLLRIINELNAGGAEALAINGIRLGPRTQVRTVGQGIYVGVQGVQPPYEIAAIGEPATLEKAITFSGGIATQLQARAQLIVSRHDLLLLDASQDEGALEYAQVFGEVAP